MEHQEEKPKTQVLDTEPGVPKVDFTVRPGPPTKISTERP